MMGFCCKRRYCHLCRPASTDALDNNKPIGIPGFADWPSHQADQYYFVTVSTSPTCPTLCF
jgi:hypothetical protein